MSTRSQALAILSAWYARSGQLEAMNDILRTIEADIRRRKAHQAQQIAISQNAKARAQKWAALIAQSTKEKPCSE